jgi:hypothetical protein
LLHVTLFFWGSLNSQLCLLFLFKNILK